MAAKKKTTKKLTVPGRGRTGPNRVTGRGSFNRRAGAVRVMKNLRAAKRVKAGAGSHDPK